MTETSHANYATSSGSQPELNPPANDTRPYGDGSSANRDAGIEEGKRETPEARSSERKPPDVPHCPNFWAMYRRRDKVYTQEEQTEAWSKAGGMVQVYSDEMIKRWKEEIDTYLVFAGLFSAVLTTFNVQTYALLQPSSPDASLVVLQQISMQLASFSSGPQSVNLMQPSRRNTLDARLPAPPLVPVWAVWLNVLWFSGLILSLAAASIGILVKQWLNECGGGLSGMSRPVTRLRQYRLRNLRTWHVEEIVGTIPILLQLALAFFLAGMLILLWSLHHTVAAVASALVGLLAIFTIATTLLPLFDHNCSYLTPQIRGINSIWQPKRLVYWSCAWISAGCGIVASFLSSSSSTLPSEPRPHWRLGSVLQLSSGVMQPASTLFRRLEIFVGQPTSWDRRKQTWAGRERSAIGEIADDLDKETLLEAYNSTLHPDALSAASVCLMSFPHHFVLDYFRKLHTSAREHFGPAADTWNGPLAKGNQQQMLWLQVLLCVVREDRHLLSEEETAALALYFEWGSWPSSMKEPHAEWAITTMNFILGYESTGSRRLGFLDQDRLPMEREYFLENALRRKEPFLRPIMPAIWGMYGEVRVSQSLLDKASSDNAAQAAHTRYLKCVERFLKCAGTVFNAPMPSADLENVCSYVRDVLIQLTSNMLEVFAKDSIRTTIDMNSLVHLLARVRDLDDSTVKACVPDSLVPDILQLMGLLSTSSDYDIDYAGRSIQERARGFMNTLIRVKCLPDIRASAPSHTPQVCAESGTGPTAIGLTGRPSDRHTRPPASRDTQTVDSSYKEAVTSLSFGDISA